MLSNFLTPKDFLLCIHQNHSQTAISRTSNKVLIKNIFGHMFTKDLVRNWFEKMWKKIQKFSPCRLQDISIWSNKNPFFVTMKSRAAALHKVKSLWKKSQNGCNYMDSFFKASWLHAWKILDHLESYNI